MRDVQGILVLAAAAGMWNMGATWPSCARRAGAPVTLCSKFTPYAPLKCLFHNKGPTASIGLAQTGVLCTVLQA